MDPFLKAIKLPDDKPASKLQLWWWDLTSHIPYRWSNRYHKVKCFFFPCHKELRKTIPRDWADLVSIIEEFLFECVVDFVEREKCFDVTVYSDEDRYELMGLYNFAKTERHQIAAEVSRSLDEWYKIAYPDDTDFIDNLNRKSTPESEVLFEIHNQLEDNFDRRKTKHLKRIVELRNTLWT
jgi:hypothetical protein